MPIFDHFNLIAPFYDRAIPRNEVDSLLRHLSLPAPGALLDAGGGTGRVSAALRAHIDRIVVIDLAYGMLRQAALKNGLLLSQSHTEALPFPDASFERVLMVDALHHVCDHADTAAELWRVLKPGGRIVIEEPDLRHFGVKLIAVAEKLLLMRSHFLAPPEIAALFPFPQARTEVVLDGDGFNAWVVVEKSV
ncbi:MAG: class I SAM-dependent methyltransferase [Anaerolineales bacterium]|jgi:demethylmenaquinone methyltransferase/2-methoxy-6-polyprenyl-1,4-benzoquinol methylase